MTIKVSSNIHDLTGEGEEWLVTTISELVIAKFIDGKLVTGCSPSGNSEETKV